MMARPSLVLASASPRRSALLMQRGVSFEVIVSEVDEDLDGPIAPGPAAELLAQRKVQAVASRVSADRFVLGADTVVAIGPDEAAELLGKPEDAAQAARMLQALSGTRHRVITGVSIGHAGRIWTASECTWVHMRPIEPREVEAYVASGEWQDKAGGYAIQENADAFVDRLEGGGFDNVVGLPVDLALRLLEDAGWRPEGA